MRLKVKVLFCDVIFLIELIYEIEYVVTIFVELFICT